MFKLEIGPRGSNTNKTKQNEDSSRFNNYFTNHKKTITNFIPKIEKSISTEKKIDRCISQHLKTEVDNFQSKRSSLQMNVQKEFLSNQNIIKRLQNKTPVSDNSKQQKYFNLNYSSNHNEQRESRSNFKIESNFFYEYKRKQSNEKDFKQNKDLSNSIWMRGIEKQITDQDRSNERINYESEKKAQIKIQDRMVTKIELSSDKKVDQVIPQLQEKNQKYQTEIMQLKYQLKEKNKQIEDLTTKLNEIQQQLNLEQFQYKQTYNCCEEQREQIIQLKQVISTNYKYEKQYTELESINMENKNQIQKLEDVILQLSVKIIESEKTINKQRQIYESIIFNQFKKFNQNKKEPNRSDNLNGLFNTQFNSFIQSFYRELIHRLTKCLTNLTSLILYINENFQFFKRQQGMKSITYSTTTLNQQDELSYSFIEFANMQEIKNHFEQNFQVLSKTSSISLINI